jgi:ATP-binding cassette subfamily B protein RaxB
MFSRPAGFFRSVPVILQSESAECGLACLAMVASYHGYHADLTTLRQRYSTSLKGTSLRQLIQMADHMALNARALRGEMANLERISLPAILHWDLDHFVVLTKVRRGVRGRRYQIVDPAQGSMVLGEEEVSRHFTGVILEVGKAERFVAAKAASKVRLTDLWTSTSGLWEPISHIIVTSIILQAAVLVSPLFLKTAIDNVLPHFNLGLLTQLLVGFLFVATLQFLSSWLRSVITSVFTNELSYQITFNLFGHLVKLPLSYFEKRHVGDVISRFNATQSVTQFLTQGVLTSFIDGVMAVLTLFMMYLYSPLLSLVSLGFLTLHAAARFLLFRPLRRANLASVMANALESSVFIESLRGIAAIKAFGQEANRRRLWQRFKVDAVNNNVKLGRVTAIVEALGQYLARLEDIVFVFLAVRLIMAGSVTVGVIFAVLAYKQQFLAAAMRLIDQVANFRILQVHLDRIGDIVLTRQEDECRLIGAGHPDFSQCIEVKDVRFSYASSEKDVLEGVDLTIAPGEIIALTGKSGGGKTTLMKIVMGLMEPTSGDVLIGGRSISSFSRQELRRQIGSIAQDDVLYAGSLSENISFFDPAIDMDRVEEVARIAQIHDEIDALPLGYDTLVGDMGSVLSGGQKQRILLARALYGKPSILFVDEGTAHLDAENERKVLEAIRKLAITRILVAHRPASIEIADRVISVDHGRAVEARRDSLVSPAA